MSSLRSGAVAAGALVLWGATACAPAPPARLDEDAPVIARVEGPRDLRERAAAFYGHLVDRRVNSLDTYSDPALRDFFSSPEAFTNYYANLAEALDRAYFQDNRPTAAEVEAIEASEGGGAQLRVRYRGQNRLPLSWWEAVLVREDRWERSEERWWIVPGKL